MAVKPRYLVDKSAIARIHIEAVAARLHPLYAEGAFATCGIVDLEMLFSAQSRSDYRAILRDRQRLPRVVVGGEGIERAIQVQAELAESSRHRAASIPDLLIAAAAERAGLTVLHFDADYDVIASVTGQSVEWVVPQGTVP